MKKDSRSRLVKGTLRLFCKVSKGEESYVEKNVGCP